ncbi:MAG: gliding motility-associated C-terminal domain-containing protein, partial [Bacteroidota bacterium]
WSDPSIMGPNPQLPSGLFNLTVTDGNGCDVSEDITIAIQSPLAIEVVGIDPSCEAENGQIIILPSGTGSSIRIAGMDYVQTDSLTGLGPGFYAVSVLDTLGCTSEFLITLSDPATFTIDLPNDTIIRIGESVPIPANVIGIPAGSASYQWFESASLSCDSCQTVVARPFVTTTYNVLVSDGLGCTKADSITIFVDDRPRIYVPNVFSPNFDGINDRFTIFGANEVEEVELLQIHERWGGMVWEATNFPPNDAAFGWDGTFNGQILGQGVYVYHLRVRLLDGRQLSFAGEVLLLR